MDDKIIRLDNKRLEQTLAELRTEVDDAIVMLAEAKEILADSEYSLMQVQLALESVYAVIEAQQRADGAPEAGQL